MNLGNIDFGALIACFALAAATLAFVFAIQPDPGDSSPRRSQLDQLLERRDTLYDNLRDLKFEYRAGKFSEKDFEETKLSLETETAMVIAEIEQFTQSGAIAGRRAAATGNSKQ